MADSISAGPGGDLCTWRIIAIHVTEQFSASSVAISIISSSSAADLT